MEDTAHRVGSVVWALLMLFFGLIYAIATYGSLREWPSLARGLSVCVVLIAVSSVVMTVCGLLLLITLGRLRPLLRVGGIAAATCGAVLIGGVLTNAIPCSGSG